MKLFPQPFSFSARESFWLRLFLALIAFYSLPEFVSATAQPTPNGLAHWIDFTFLHERSTYNALRGIFLIAGAFYVANILPVAALAYMSALYLSVGTYENSQGYIGHSTQLLGIILLGQWIWFRLTIATYPKERSVERHSRAHWITIQIIAAVYVVTAVTKLINSEGEWIKRAKYFPVQIHKTQKMDYYNRLGENPQSLKPKNLLFGEQQIAAISSWMIEHPNGTRLVLGAGLLLELTVFLALYSRRLALLYGISIILFHETVSQLMRLDFIYHELLVAAFLINPVYWISWYARRKKATTT